MREFLVQLHGEIEARTRTLDPRAADFGAWLAVERRIDLDGIEVLRVEPQFVEVARAVALRAGGRIEQAVPSARSRRIAPPRCANQKRHVVGRSPPRRKPSPADPSLIIKGLVTINEIFYSVQGESTYAGRPCVFVRLTACDLRCSWCDTPYAFYEGSKRSLDDVIGEVDRYGCSLVEVTGGEPLLQEEVYPLMQRLLDSGKTVLLETGGHRSTERVPADVVTILDVKCPGSGEVAKNDWTNLKRLRPKDEVKFVVKDRADYEFARDVIARHALVGRASAIHLSPVHGVLDPKTLSEWVLADKLLVRVQLQLHKYIWSPDTRGV